MSSNDFGREGFGVPHGSEHINDFIANLEIESKNNKLHAKGISARCSALMDNFLTLIDKPLTDITFEVRLFVSLLVCSFLTPFSLWTRCVSPVP